MYELPKTNEEVFSGEAGKQRVRKLLDRLGNPQDDHRTIHVAASSGKGTIAMLATQLLLANNRSVGTIMSPHVYDLRERFLVNGQKESKRNVLIALEKIRRVVLQLNGEGVYPSYYETVLAVGYLVFSVHKLDYIVVETGFGGRLDGTNHITRKDKVAVLGQIGLDHVDILGDTLEKIAREKAGIVTRYTAAFALEQDSGVNEVFKSRSEEQEAKLTFINGESFRAKQSLNLGSLNSSFVGNHNYDDLALALSAVQYVAQRDDWKFASESIVNAVIRFQLPGRFEVIKSACREIILDGAHSEQKLAAFVQALKKNYPEMKFSIVFACARKRNPETLINILKPICNEFVFTKYGALKNDAKRRAYDFTGYKVDGVPSTTMNNAEKVIEYIAQAYASSWLVTGSFFLVSDLGPLLAKQNRRAN